jgi:PAS domain S-box-containing protein
VVISSVEKLRQALTTAGLGVFGRDLGSDAVSVTPRMREIFAWSADEPITVSGFLDRVHPEDRAQVAASIGHADDPAGDGLLSVEHRLLLPDGRTRWVTTNARTFFEDDGAGQRLAHRVGTVLDITDRKQAEEQLRASEERYALFERGVNDGIWDWNIQTGEHYQSARWKEIVGSRDDAMPNTESSFFDRIHPDDTAAVTDALRRHYDEGARYEVEVRLRHRDGSYRWILSRGEAVRDAAGRPVRMVGALTDITDRKEAEEQLRASERRYALFERGVNDGVWDWNIQTGEHYHSPRWKEIVGSRDDAVPNTESSFFDRIHPDDAAAVTDALRRHYEEGARYAVEVRLRHRDGGYRWVLSRGEAVRDAAGRPVRMVGALTDISDRKQAEEALRQAHDELEARVHDRTRALQDSQRALRALSASLLTAQEDERRRLARELHDDVTQQLALASIEIGTLASDLPRSPDATRVRLQALQERVIQISRDVRRVSHGLHPALIEDLGLSAALEAFCDEFRRARGLPVSFDGAGDVDDSGIGLTAASALYRVAQEGVANAAKHARASRVDVALRRTPSTLELEVEDNGIGMAADASRVTPGLGLVSMEERMRLVAGTLRVSPRTGGGTRVVASVPLGKD